MTRRLGQREAWGLAALPCLVILIIYVFAFERPQSQALRGLRQASDAARQRAVPPSRVKSEELEVAALSAQLEQERQRKDAAIHPSLVLPSRWPNKRDRPAILAQVGAVCAQCALHIETTAPAGDTGNCLSKSLQDLAAAVGRESVVEPPRVWRIDLVGAYGDLVAALKAVDNMSRFVVPLTVRMESIGGETRLRRWTVWLWM